MQYLGGKLSAAQHQVAGWVGSFRRSLQGALELVRGPSDEKQEVDEEEDVDDKEKEEGEDGDGDGGGRFQRAMSPLRSFARRSRHSLRSLSARSRQPLQKIATETCSPQVNSYFTNDEDKPNETLFHSEPPQQYGVSEQTPKPDSPTPIPDPVPDVSSEDVDCTDSPREPDLAPFPEISTPLLDTSTQRSKAVLSRRRTRSRPSRSLRLGSIKAARVEFNMHDGEKGAESKENDSDSEEEPPKSKPASSPATSTQKVPMFPGLSPAALLAGIKKKTGGGAAGAGEGTAKDRGGQEKESQNKEVASSPSQISGSPRLPAHLAGAARVLPPNDSKEGSPSSSPAWLKELKSKKRMSQHNGET